MLVVRAEQFEKVVKTSEEDFINYLVAYVRGNHADAVAEQTDDALKKMIRSGIERARRYRIERVADTEIFIGKMFDVAPNFDEQTDINAVLTDERLAPANRLEILLSPSISKESWEEARRNYDEKAWSAPARRKSKSPKKS